MSTKPVRAETASDEISAITDASDKFGTSLFYIIAGMVMTVPLAMLTTVYHISVLPKFIILLVGSALALFILCLITGFNIRGGERLRLLQSNQVLLVSLYLCAVALSTRFGVAPLASFFGSLESRMGLLSALCFFICFIALVVAVGRSEKRLITLLWAMAIVGLLIAAYAFAQFIGRDPFLAPNSYLFASRGGGVRRVPGTLGHADYLGNFLLYTTPVSATLALISRGRAQRVAVAGAGLSLAAIVFSGTRGAWFGAVASIAVFAFFWLQNRRADTWQFTRQQKFTAAIITAVVLVFIGVLVASPARSHLSARLRSSALDPTGSGRTLLWRDAIKMVPAYALTGCGPEGFSKAFLAYKSPQLARSASEINNESSHNLYLDAFISYGLAGGILYLAVLVSTFLLLLRLRRRTNDERLRMIIQGLFAAFVAVCAHNLFIYNQIPTGLYFFAFVALALAAANVVKVQEPAPVTVAASRFPVPVLRVIGWLLPPIGMAILLWACWYAAGAAQSDAAIKRAFAAAAAKDYEQLVSNGQTAVQRANATGAYDYLFARALSNYVDILGRGASNNSANNRAPAIELAMSHGEAALAHSLTPEANCVLLAYLALAANDQEKLHTYAAQALAWDRNLFSAHWLMGEAWLAEGNREAAAAEAKAATDLRPRSLDAQSLMARARGDALIAERTVQGWLERAQIAESRMKFKKASEMLKQAIRAARGPCAPCHRALALVYERMGFYEQAMDEWGTMMSQSPELAAQEHVATRIYSLKQKAAAQKASP